MQKTLALLAFLLFAAGCTKDIPCAPEQTDYFVFGTTYGECIGDCVCYFKLQGDQLFPDDHVGHGYRYTDALSFQCTSLPADKVALAKALQEQIPAALYNEPDGRIGCPDCYDQGGIIVKIKSGASIHSWSIDPHVQQYAAFCNSIRTTVQLLR